MTLELLTPYIAAVGSVAAIVISVLGYRTQARAESNRALSESAKIKLEVDKAQGVISTQIWALAQEQLEIEVIREEGNTNIGRIREELRLERANRRASDAGQRRLVAIVTALLTQLISLGITPDISPEDKNWLYSTFAGSVLPDSEMLD